VEEKLLEIIANQANVINELTQLVQSLSLEISRDVVIKGFKKTPDLDVN